MSEQSQRDDLDFRTSDLIEPFRHLPWWLADRFLLPDEKVTWVRGPRFNPSWERYLTHPALFFVAFALGAFSTWLVRSIAGEWSQLSAIVLLFSLALVYAAIVVLGSANGYFTRLVVTNVRLAILQGYEICRTWSIDDLPPSLLRYGRRGEEEKCSIDLNVVKTMLGNSTDKFADAKTILSFGKQLDRITTRDKDGR